jgi:hypothetical protein
MSQTSHARVIIFDHPFLSFPLWKLLFVEPAQDLGSQHSSQFTGVFVKATIQYREILLTRVNGQDYTSCLLSQNSLYPTGHQTNSFKKKLCAPACVLYYFYSKLLLTKFKSLANTVPVLLFPSLLSSYLVNNYISSSLRSCKRENSMQDKYMIKCLTGIYLDSNSRFLL